MSKKVNRRQVLKAIVLGGTGITLSACQAPAVTPPATTAIPEPKPQDRSATSYQGRFVIMSVANADQSAPLIQAIEEAHPGVKIEWRFLPSERFVELFTAAEVAGDQIDVMDLNGQDLRRYAVGGKLKDLSDIPYKDRFREVALKTYTIGGKTWALPRGGISGFTYLINKKAFERVGFDKEISTYDELRMIAPELKRLGIAPVTHPGKNIYLWPVWQFWAYAQTSGNQSVENTFKTLAGEMKFTDLEHVAALEALHDYAMDGMFIDSVNSLEGDTAWVPFTQGNAAIYYMHTSRIAAYRAGDFPELDMSLIAPLRHSGIGDAVVRQMPGGTGNALGIYARIASERETLARSVIDLMTSDTWVRWVNELRRDPVSCNANVQASDDELALKYARDCSPHQTTYLDWFWPPEVTRAFQENQQAIVALTKKPNEAAQSIQKVLDDLYKDGYQFQT